ncbi:MAG TPA: hypothetical protein VFG50_06925, partial [Rhodothermales bacterium]|nr:hypothetical protein [Rhodothermales bacterium]
MTAFAPPSSPYATIKTVCCPADGHPVEKTAAEVLCARLKLPPAAAASRPGEGLRIGLAGGTWGLAPAEAPDGAREPWMWARIAPDGTGELTASEPALLYALTMLLEEGLTLEQQSVLPDGLLLRASFAWNRPLYDSVLTQVARSARGFDPEAYVARLAACGFTHVEVNGLAYHTPMEPGVPTEYYNQFYTYCPALSQFVDSKLTKGLYPSEYLQANLIRLKRTAELGR